MSGKLVTVAVAIAVALAVMALGRQPEAQGQRFGEAPQWEYKVVNFRSGLDPETKFQTGTDEETKLLTKLGDEGWQYVGLVATPSGGSIYGLGGHVAFKRPKKQAP
jgi:hypothetical protein